MDVVRIVSTLLIQQYNVQYTIARGQLNDHMICIYYYITDNVKDRDEWVVICDDLKVW